VPARLALERHDWEAAAQIRPGLPKEVMWDEYPNFEAISYFALALGAAHQGDSKVAEKAIAELARLEGGARELDIAYGWGIQVAIQRTAAEAWLAFESGDAERGLELAAEAAEMEGTTEKSPVTPGEILPALELYGDMLRAADRHDEAIAAYETALARSPNRFNSLYGAGRAAEQASDSEAASGFYTQLIDICPEEGADRPELDHAREFLAASH
jgi:tetratricopeptide (TPR) repeat protein